MFQRADSVRSHSPSPIPLPTDHCPLFPTSPLSATLRPSTITLRQTQMADKPRRINTSTSVLSKELKTLWNQHFQKTGGGAPLTVNHLLQASTPSRALSATTSSLDPCPPAPPYREFPSLRNRPARRSATSSAPNVSATSAGTGTGALFSTEPAAPSLAPGCAHLYRHAAKNIPKAAATSGWPSPG